MAKILIIDDDSAFCDFLRPSLEDAGYEVLTASDGDLGLKAFNERRPDLVITDVIMQFSGLNVIRGVNQSPNPVPVIGITGSLLSAAALQEEELDVFEVLVKPFPLDDLLATVAAALAS